MTALRPLAPLGGRPSEDEVLGYLRSLSNWGRWGAEDQIGTLNLITDEHRRVAAGLVRRGQTVSLSCEITTSPATDANAQRWMVKTGEGLQENGRVREPEVIPGVPTAAAMEFAVENMSMTYHGADTTHLDALSHYMWDGTLYNGHDAASVSAQFGATRLDVRGAAAGIVTRGVLVDMPRLLSQEWLNADHGVTVTELEAALEAQGTQVGAGDVLLLRTGHRHADRPAEEVTNIREAGWQAEVLPWLHDHDIAMIGSDGSNDVLPSGYSTIPVPVHTVALTAMGLWLLDNCNLEPLAHLCAELGSWEFLFVASPLVFQGLTGSPVNPLAVF